MNTHSNRPSSKKTARALSGYSSVHKDIVELLQSARQATARTVNVIMTTTYWEIGRRIVEFEQGGKGRAAYGEALMQRLASDLTHQFGRGFSRQNLQQMRLFYLAWPPGLICQTPSGKSGNLNLGERFPLPWSAYVRLLSVHAPEARQFYETEALRAGWSVRQLDRQIIRRGAPACAPIYPIVFL
jgi:hypothetical protein